MSDSHEIIKALSDGNANGSDGSQGGSPLLSLGLNTLITSAQELGIRTQTEQKSFGSAIQRSFSDVGRSLGLHGVAILMIL